MQSTPVLLALLGLFAVAFATSITSVNQIPAVGILVKLKAEGVYARLLSNDKLMVDDLAASNPATFLMTKQTVNGQDYINLKNPSNGLYVSAEEKGKKSLRAVRPEAKSWENFIAIFEQQSGSFSLVAATNNRYLKVQPQGTIIANGDLFGVVTAETKREIPEGALQFVIETAQVDTAEFAEDGGVFYFRYLSNFGGSVNQFVSPAPANAAQTYEIAEAVGPAAAPWTSYTFKAIQNQKYLCSTNGVIAPTCTDPSQYATHFHFWNATQKVDPLAANSNVLSLANYENKLLQADCPTDTTCTMQVGTDSIDTNSNQRFQFPPTKLPDPTKTYGVTFSSASTSPWILNAGTGKVLANSNVGNTKMTFTTEGHIVTGSNYFYIDASNELAYISLSTPPTDLKFQFTVKPATSAYYVISSDLMDGKYLEKASTSSKITASGTLYQSSTALKLKL